MKKPSEEILETLSNAEDTGDRPLGRRGFLKQLLSGGAIVAGGWVTTHLVVGEVIEDFFDDVEWLEDYYASDFVGV